MDHSAFDAHAFLIESHGKRLLYSGDFRKHGRKGKAFQFFLNKVPSGINVLLLEGSLLGRTTSKQLDEKALEADLVKIIKSSENIVFGIISSQNIDRLVSFFKAALRTKRLLVIDVYTANVLSSLKEFAKLPHPSDNFPNIKVFFPKYICDRLRQEGKIELMTKFRDFRITKKEIAENRGSILMLVRPSMLFDLSRIRGIQSTTIIYSMWEGYLKEPSVEKFLAFVKKRNMKMTHLHTSGHADIDTLKIVADRLKPKQIIPMHTFYPDFYKNLFPNVRIVNDGDKVEI
jgi:ribonuclease J